jgi:hypothetical protein
MTENPPPRLSFHPYEPDGSPRVFVGMFRPPYESLTEEELQRLLPLGILMVKEGYQRERWLAGRLYRPLYAAHGEDPPA